MKIIKDLNQLEITPNIRAVIFDCFGTLMEITAPHKPYKYLYNELKKLSIIPENYATWVMSKSLTLEDIEKELNIQIPLPIKSEFNKKVYLEIQSIRNFQETNIVLKKLAEKKIKTALCSNLALPYGLPAKTHTYPLNHYFLSYELGWLKPNPELFQHCQTILKEEKENIIFVGDNEKDDYLGSQNFGFNSYWLKRE